MIHELEKFAKILKQTRKDKNLSQQELSKVTGVSQRHISKVESSEVDLRLKTFTTLADALGLKVLILPKKTVLMLKLEHGRAGPSIYGLEDDKKYVW